jgi:hypothetical protein
LYAFILLAAVLEFTQDPAIQESTWVEEEQPYDSIPDDTTPQTTILPPTTTQSPNNMTFGIPFVIVPEGKCSGMTAIGHYIRRIVDIHGFTRTEDVNFEFLNANTYNPRSNSYKN